MPIKISVVVPTLNEEINIAKFLDSLLNQTRKPDEIIISDGGSIDKTVFIINNYIKKNNIIKIVSRDGKCRGSGRNSGIKKSNNEYIALIDAGTLPHKNWLEQLSYTLENNIKADCVYGAVIPHLDSTFAECLSAFAIGKNRYDGKILHSVSSILISKKLWLQTGKFPESKNNEFVVEDLIFIENIKKSSFIQVTNKKAIVEWILPKTYQGVFSKYFNYFYGGLFTGHAKKLSTIRNLIIYLFLLIFGIFFNYLFLFILLINHLFRSYTYFINSFWINKKYGISFISKFIVTSFLLIVIDLATYSALLTYTLRFKWIKFQS